MIDYKKLYSELGGVGNVSPELAYEARGLERAKGSLFDSSHPLAFDNAQNTAQRAKDKSDELQEAFKAASAGDFAQMRKIDTFHKRPEEILKAGGYIPSKRLEQMLQPGTAVSGADIASAYKQDQAEQRIADARARGILPNPQDLKITGRTENVMFGMPGMGGGGRGYSNLVQPPQTSTSNIAPYGFDEHGNRIVQSNLEPMPSEGLPVSKYQKK